MEREKTARDVSKLLLHCGAIIFEPHTLSSGLQSPIYQDCRVIWGYLKERSLIRNLYIDMITSTNITFDVIAGTATAGIPPATLIAEKMKLPLSYVRDAPKTHGMQEQIEGARITKGQKVAVIEDLISTGKSSINTIRALREKGAEAYYVFAITTNQMEIARRNFMDQRVKLTTLTNVTTTLEVARKYGYVSSANETQILEWIKDPAAWKPT